MIFLKIKKIDVRLEYGQMVMEANVHVRIYLMDFVKHILLRGEKIGG